MIPVSWMVKELLVFPLVICREVSPFDPESKSVHDIVLSRETCPPIRTVS